MLLKDTEDKLNVEITQTWFNHKIEEQTPGVSTLYALDLFLGQVVHTWNKWWFITRPLQSSIMNGITYLRSNSTIWDSCVGTGKETSMNTITLYLSQDAAQLPSLITLYNICLVEFYGRFSATQLNNERVVINPRHYKVLSSNSVGYNLNPFVKFMWKLQWLDDICIILWI